MLEVLSTSAMPNDKTSDASFGPGKVTILNPKQAAAHATAQGSAPATASSAPATAPATPRVDQGPVSAPMSTPSPASAPTRTLSEPQQPQQAQNVGAPVPHQSLPQMSHITSRAPQSAPQSAQGMHGPQPQMQPQMQQPQAQQIPMVPQPVQAPVQIPQASAPAPAPVAPGTPQAPAGSRAQTAPAAASPAPLASASSPAASTSAPLQSAAQPAQGDDHVCSNCGVTDTPLWRRGLRGEIMCNACGLYVKSRRISRPVTLKRAARTKTVPKSDDTQQGTCPGSGQCNGTGGSQACTTCPTYNNRQQARDKASANTSEQVLISCQNCGTVTTPLWRRDNDGNTICNACGLYLKMHHEHRPVRMIKNTIKRRKRGPSEPDSPEADARPQRVPSFDGYQPQSQGQPHPQQQGQPQLRPGFPPPIDFTTEPLPPQGHPQLPQGHPSGLPPPQIKAELPNYQPLSLLEYLSGDSKKEYLLAVRRQLQDRVSQCEAQLNGFLRQLAECDETIKSLN